MLEFVKKNKNVNHETSGFDIDETQVFRTLEREYLTILLVDIETEVCKLYKARFNYFSLLENENNKPLNYTELISTYINDHIYVEDRTAALHDMALSNMVEEFKTNDYFSITCRVLSPDGDLRYIKHEARHVSGSEGKRLLVTAMDVDDEIHQDMNRQEQLRQAYLTAERASLAKNEFMHNMSHDIRTPLNAIVGYTSVAREHLDNAALSASYLDKIDTASQHLIHIINEILDLRELEEGNIKLSNSVLTMNELINQVIDTVNPLVGDKQIKLSLINEDKENPSLCFDAFHLRRILTNLLSNAIKFSDNGGEVILGIVSSEGSDRNKRHYTFTVEDFGIGMSEEFVEKMFKPFERERTSTQSKKTGIGIGLSIVKNIVDAMGGSVNAHSVKGEGTTIIVELEFEVAASDMDEASESSDAERTVEKKRILVVDDSKVNRDIAVAILESFGFVTDTAADGDEAVEKVGNSANEHFDLIIMDIQMPRVDGYEAARQIRALDRADAVKLPIIALTADVFEDTQKKAADYGMNDFLTKPIDVKKLKTILDEYLY